MIFSIGDVTENLAKLMAKIRSDLSKGILSGDKAITSQPIQTYNAGFSPSPIPMLQVRQSSTSRTL